MSRSAQSVWDVGCSAAKPVAGSRLPSSTGQSIGESIFWTRPNAYQKGLSEEYVGATLSKNGKRQQIVLATKVHFRVSEDDPNAFGNSRRHILEQCETSLRRLRTDYIDLYQIHRPQSEVPIDETLQALDDLVRAGKVRYVGTSNFAAWQLVESLWASRELRLNRFVSEQPAYNLLDRRAEREFAAHGAHLRCCNSALESVGGRTPDRQISSGHSAAIRQPLRQRGQ